jgi:hypothetical protein
MSDTHIDEHFEYSDEEWDLWDQLIWDLAVIVCADAVLTKPSPSDSPPSRVPYPCEHCYETAYDIVRLLQVSCAVTHRRGPLGTSEGSATMRALGGFAHAVHDKAAAESLVRALLPSRQQPGPKD